jgi:two-component system sensor histidine kinase PhoQ
MPDPAAGPGRAFSLRARLVALATGVLVVALGLVGVALNQAHYRGAVSLLESQMDSYLYLVLAAADVDEAGVVSVTDLPDPRLNQPGSGTYVHLQAAGADWSSPSALGVELPPAAGLEPGQRRFTEAGGDANHFILRYGVAWELADGRTVPLTVSVLVDAAEIGQQTGAFRRSLWRSLGGAAIILALAQLLILYLVFRPFRRVASDVAAIESGATERLEGRYPNELEPLVRNVNRLLETEKSNQQRIRNALDSLAHSLKTPLAVIQAGLPLHGGASEASMQNAVGEMERLIATRLERAGSSARRTLAAPVPVAPQLERVLDSLRKVHSHKMISAGVTLEDELAFYGEQRDLLELVGNLVDNAFKYGSSKVHISAGAVDGQAARPGLWLRVEDDGPGIEPSQRQRLLQRGARGDERVEGHGLGLAIVMELVTAYGGEVAIGDSELGGAMIGVSLPAN